jgi:hypothetical protein
MSNMPLSEAIRLGSMLRPQVFGGLYATVDVTLPGDILGLKQAVVASCALGAAFEAAHCPTEYASTTGVPLRGSSTPLKATQVVRTPWEWEPVLRLTTQCPICQARDVVVRLIPHWNDLHRMSREQIADLVEVIERHVAPASTKEMWLPPRLEEYA